MWIVAVSPTMTKNAWYDRLLQQAKLVLAERECLDHDWFSQLPLAPSEKIAIWVYIPLGKYIDFTVKTGSTENQYQELTHHNGSGHSWEVTRRLATQKTGP